MQFEVIYADNWITMGGDNNGALHFVHKYKKLGLCIFYIL